MLRKLSAFVLGALVFLVGLELALVALQAGFDRWQWAENEAALSGERGDVVVLTIGESTTAVAGDPTGKVLVPQTSYPTQLERLLNERQDKVSYKVLNHGMMGGHSPAILERLEPALERFQPAIVIAMMGIKDTPDMLLPASQVVPEPFRALRTVQLGAWLYESVMLQKNQRPLDVVSVDELPRSLRISQTQLRKYIKELRLLGGGVGAGPMPELELATYYWFIGRHVKAAELLEQTIATYEVGYNLLARVLLTNAQAGEAIALMEGAVRAHPDDVVYHHTLADLLVLGGRFDEAQAVLDEAAERLPDTVAPELAQPYLALSQAELYKEAGEPERALEVLAALENPTRVPAGFWETFPSVVMLRDALLGEVYLELERFDEAEAVLLDALETFPTYRANMWTLAKVYRATGRHEDEERLRREGLTETPRLANYYELARMYRLQGDRDRIPELFEEATERIPTLRASYAELYETVEAHGARLVVMQYPSMPLEAMYPYAPPAPGVHFIDNEHLFDAAPDDYWFEARFPHSFSHYTEAGALLLAEHVADELLALAPDRS